MIRQALSLLLTLLLACTMSMTHAQNRARAQGAIDATAVAQRLLDHLDAQRWEQAEVMLDADMQKAVPAARLGEVWRSLPPAGERGQAHVSRQNGMQIVVVPLTRGGATLNATVAVAENGRVAGFLVQPGEPPAAEAVPADANYLERDFSVGSGDDALPGTLAMPKGAGPFPAVVLVHGSGPHDRDETIGPNRPFLDIARGLAAQGIAVLRYEKRTKAHPQAFANGDYTIDDETTNDAVAALAALRAAPGIDPRRVFVLGHSQGAMMAPRIVQRANGAAGAILLAAPARPLLDILVEQNRRLAGGGSGSATQAEQAFIDTLVRQVAAIRDGSAQPGDTPLGVPAHYWRSVDAVDILGEARATRVPLLILHGGRDIQVVDADWQAWQQTFRRNRNVTLRAYPALNHLGMAGTGPGSLAEYQVPGKVDETLINDIAGWIKARRR